MGRARFWLKYFWPDTGRASWLPFGTREIIGKKKTDKPLALFMKAVYEQHQQRCNGPTGGVQCTINSCSFRICRTLLVRIHALDRPVWVCVGGINGRQHRWVRMTRCQCSMQKVTMDGNLRSVLVFKVMFKRSLHFRPVPYCIGNQNPRCNPKKHVSPLCSCTKFGPDCYRTIFHLWFYKPSLGMYWIRVQLKHDTNVFYRRFCLLIPEI